MSVDDHVADLSGGVVRSPSAHCCVFLFLCSRCGGLVSGNHFTSCVFVSGECVFMGRWGGVVFQEMLHLQISFYGNPAMIAVAGIQLREGWAERKMCIFCILCLSFQSMTLLSSPFPPPNPTPVCRCAEEEDCFPSHSK